MLVLFNSVAEYRQKNSEIAQSLGYPKEGTTHYADHNPIPTKDGKYAMPILSGFEKFFTGMTILESDEGMYPVRFLAPPVPEGI